MPTAAPTTEQRAAYYTAAALGLRALDAREGRGLRFGPDADATWRVFAGPHHTPGHRLELLLRDAAVPWGLAFDARAIFGLDGVATDDPFGPRWLHRADAGVLDAPAPTTLGAIAAALGLSPAPAALPPLTPASHLVLAGPGAVLAAAAAFAATPGLAWDRQVTVVAQAPAHRQLAGLAALFVPTDAATRVRWPTDPLPSGTAVVSPDADRASADAVERR